jgi:uncharacterized MAPEG superfamily protein
MTPELTYLAWTALLTGSVWVIYVTCQVVTNGFLGPQDYRDPTPRPVPLWGLRANRVLMNGAETFAPFAAMVLIIQISGQNNGTTAFLCMAFFWLRLAHAVVYMAAIPYIRTLLFTLGWIAELGLFWQIVT